MAVVQLRNRTEGRAYFDAKKAAGKTSMEAIRALKRRLSNVVYARMVPAATWMRSSWPPSAPCRRCDWSAASDRWTGLSEAGGCRGSRATPGSSSVRSRCSSWNAGGCGRCGRHSARQRRWTGCSTGGAPRRSPALAEAILLHAGRPNGLDRLAAGVAAERPELMMTSTFGCTWRSPRRSRAMAWSSIICTQQRCPSGIPWR